MPEIFLERFFSKNSKNTETKPPNLATNLSTKELLGIKTVAELEFTQFLMATSADTGHQCIDNLIEIYDQLDASVDISGNPFRYSKTDFNHQLTDIMRVYSNQVFQKAQKNKAMYTTYVIMLNLISHMDGYPFIVTDNMDSVSTSMQKKNTNYFVFNSNGEVHFIHDLNLKLPVKHTCPKEIQAILNRNTRLSRHEVKELITKHSDFDPLTYFCRQEKFNPAIKNLVLKINALDYLHEKLADISPEIQLNPILLGK